jgi:DNA-binding CsgD family transcriptional regulator
MAESGLIGREPELSRLGTALREAPERGGALLVRGAPGIGKTSLLNATAADARVLGYKVIAVTGLESEAQLPYAGLQQLVHTVMTSADRLPDPQKAALLTALGIQSASAPEVFLVALATLNLIDDAAADQPIVVIADDVQWLDDPTSSVLTFIARRLESTRIALLIGLRDGFDTPLLSAQLPEIQVGPLSETAARELVDAVAPDLEHRARRQILAQALGNPLALVELPRALKNETHPQVNRAGLLLTDRLERTFSAQANRLPQNAQSMLLLAAVNDEPSLGEVLAAARIMSGEEVNVDALTPALDSGLISIGGANIHFRHPLIRSAVEQGATPQQRRAAHGALAQVVADPDRRPQHRAASVLGIDEEAAADLEGTAVRAQERGAPTIALRALELSASLTPDGPVRARRLLAAAEIAFQMGEPAAVGRLLDTAARLHLTPHDVARMTWLREIFHDGVPGDPHAVVRLVDVARDAAAQGDRNLALNLLQGAALRCWWADPGIVAKALVIEAVAQIAGNEADPRALEILSVAAPVDAADQIWRGVREAAALDHGDASRTQLLAFAAYAAGDMDQAITLMDRVAPMLRAQARLGLLAQLLIARGWAGVSTGQFSQAAREFEEGNRLAVETAQPIWIAISHNGRAALLGLGGEEQQANQTLAETAEPMLALRLSIAIAGIELARGLIELTAGRHSDAFDHFARVFDPDGAAHHEFVAQDAAPFVIQSAVSAGRREEARRMMSVLEALGKRTPAPLVHLGIRFGRALLADDSDAEALFQLALDAEPRWPFAYARLEMAFGAWLRRQRRITESRPYLRAARDTFEALGVHPWADKARAELRASGERISDTTRAPSQPLSPQEMQIAKMAASGLSNREIADRLFLSHRTVGAHLYRVFPKLGIASRSELPLALASTEPALT